MSDARIERDQVLTSPTGHQKERRGKRQRPRPPTGSLIHPFVHYACTHTDTDWQETQTLAEQLSFLHLPRPFKSATYMKNPTRRTKNLKTVLGQERERERTERERRRVAREERDLTMDIDGAAGEEEDVPTYTSIEAPPSLLPPRHYCDITGLDAPYTDPRTGLRYHDKSVYDLIKNLSPSVAKDYLSARGVNPIVR